MEDLDVISTTAAPQRVGVYDATEFSEWQDVVKLYVGHGRDMQDAADMADLYILLRRKRSPWQKTLT